MPINYDFSDKKVIFKNLIVRNTVWRIQWRKYKFRVWVQQLVFAIAGFLNKYAVQYIWLFGAQGSRQKNFKYSKNPYGRRQFAFLLFHPHEMFPTLIRGEKFKIFACRDDNKSLKMHVFKYVCAWIIEGLSKTHVCFIMKDP